MRRIVIVGGGTLVFVLIAMLPWVMAQVDERCERRPSHPSCQTTTTPLPPPPTTTVPPSTTTTVPPSTTTTVPPSTTTTVPPPTATTVPPSTTTTVPPPTTTTIPPDSVVIAAVGDVGSWDQSQETLETLDGVDVLFVTGDLSYGGSDPEELWCDWVKGIVGDDYPVELIAGNHENGSGDSGYIRNFAECLPDKVGAVGDYGVQYYVNLGPITVIAISPDLKIDGITYNYDVGSDERVWLETEVTAARDRGDWVMIAMHKLCITAGGKNCQIGEELSNWMIANADVLVSGHEHTYLRTYPLLCVIADDFDESCIGETGAIWAINGTGGRNWKIDDADSEWGYFAAAMGNGRFAEWGYGTSQFVVTDDMIIGSYVCGGDCIYTDSYTITR